MCDHRSGIHDAVLHGAEVEVEQTLPGLGIGEVDLDRVVDPARAGRERRLEHLEAVRRQDEEDIVSGSEAVHLIEELEQQRVRRVVVHPPGGRDEVHVLDDQHRRTQAAHHGGRLPERPDARPLEHDDRPIGHRRHEVPDRVRLAGAGRSVQQHAPAQMLPRGPELVGPPAGVDRLAQDRREVRRRQDQIVDGGGGALHEPRTEPAVLVETERQHLAAVHVEVAHAIHQVREHVLGEVQRCGEDLQAHPSGIEIR